MSATLVPPKGAQDACARLDALAASRPEWRPWLLVVREVTPELSSFAWDVAPPQTAMGDFLSPMLAGAALRPDAESVARLLDRLTATARAGGLETVAGPYGRARATPPEDALGVFLAAVNHDEATLDRQASQIGAEPAGWRALAHLIPMPYLHACARRWAASQRAGWSQGYCPVCGAWPAFAEMRGIERTRHLRCGRCGAAWSMPMLTCAYCAATDHDTLGSLVAEDAAVRWTVDVCHRCSGWLKSITTLQPTPAIEVLGTDLAGVEFDLAAIERGFRRPEGPGVALHATLDRAAAGPPPPTRAPS